MSDLPPMDLSQWDWSQLNPANAGSFRWEYGKTPFSNWEAIAVSVALYLVAIFLIPVKAPLVPGKS